MQADAGAFGAGAVGRDPAEVKHGPCRTDPLGTFLHGLLTMPDLFAAGGFRMSDTTNGAVFVEPGCCNRLEVWRASTTA